MVTEQKQNKNHKMWMKKKTMFVTALGLKYDLS